MKKILSLILFFILMINEVFSQDSPQEYQNSTQIISNEFEPDKISLDIKGMDIVDVLKLLAAKTGFNVVIGKNVSGKATLFLKNVKIWDAFEIILLANDLAYEQRGEIFSIITQKEYELRHGIYYLDNKNIKILKPSYAKVLDLEKTLIQIKSTIGKIVIDEGSNIVVLIDTPDRIQMMNDFIGQADQPVKTVVYSLNYAKAEKLIPKIENLVTKGIGHITIDERTNKIIITDYKIKNDEIIKIIKEFDEKTLQVVIDAQIIEIKPSNKFEMGVDWDYWIGKHLRLESSLPNTSALNKITIGTSTEEDVTNTGDYKAIIDLLQTIGDTKILSSPRITVLNNQEAKILVGTKDAYITSAISQSGTGTAVTSQTVNFVDVGIKLYVTPSIARDGFVNMIIKPEISSSERKKILSDGRETEIPIVTTSEAETAVTIKEGVTIIIGGLRKDERLKTVRQIPFLGNIPILGFLFKNISDEIRKTELVILLTPHIISGERPYSDFNALKPTNGTVLKMINGQILKENYPQK